MTRPTTPTSSKPTQLPLHRRPALLAGAAVTAMVIIVVIVAAVLTGQRGDAVEPITATSGSHRVELRLAETRLGPVDAELLVQDPSGRPAAARQVSVEAVMPSMGHGTAELSAEPIGDGRYRIRGELFAMTGDWEVTVRIADPPAAVDTLVLPVIVNR